MTIKYSVDIHLAEHFRFDGCLIKFWRRLNKQHYTTNLNFAIVLRFVSLKLNATLRFHFHSRMVLSNLV